MFARFKVVRVVGDVAGPRDLHCVPVTADGAGFSAGKLVLAVNPAEAQEVGVGAEFDLVLTPVPAGVDVELTEAPPSPGPVRRGSTRPPKPPKGEDE